MRTPLRLRPPIADSERIPESTGEFSTVSQSDNDTRNDSSPTTSPSLPDSLTPFLSVAEGTLTPLSMHSSDPDVFSGIDASLHDKKTSSRAPAKQERNDAKDCDEGLEEEAGDARDMQQSQQKQPLAENPKQSPWGPAFATGVDRPSQNDDNNSNNDGAEHPKIRTQCPKNGRPNDPPAFNAEAQVNLVSPRLQNPVLDVNPSRRHIAARNLPSAKTIQPLQIVAGPNSPSLTASCPSKDLSAPIKPTSPGAGTLHQQYKGSHLQRFPHLDYGDFDEDPVPDALRPQPIIRTASDGALSLCHPTPEISHRSGSCVGNIAALEASAERLSMTSSIEIAIRDLNQDLKRSESRRSSRLHASAAEPSTSPRVASLAGSRSSLLGQISSASSVVNAARQCGYFPGGYIISPSYSRSAPRGLQSGSRDSRSSRNEDEHLSSSFSSAALLSRSGPGKSSQRSVRSAQPSLSEIAEIDPPVTLTQEVMDKTGYTATVDNERADVLVIHHSDGLMTPTMNSLNNHGNDVSSDRSWSQHLDTRCAAAQQPQPPQYQQLADRVGEHDGRPTTATSMTTFDQAQHAFGEFDGVHWSTDHQPQSPPMNPASDVPSSGRRMSQIPPVPQPVVGQPTSYFDVECGRQMLYYPARVPAMLNLPPKLSKTGTSAAKREQRRTHFLSHMNEVNRVSAPWLPDPLEGHTPAPFFPDKAESSPHMSSTSEPGNVKNVPGALNAPDKEPADAPASLQNLVVADVPVDVSPELPKHIVDSGQRKEPQQSQVFLDGNGNPVPGDEPRPQTCDDSPGQSQSRMSINRKPVPPELRASAYFDLPSQLPRVEIKDGSAKATLDSILDASARAPVNAFTDHLYAGKLGSEVYGREKKRKGASHSQNPSTNSLGHKSRISFFSLGKHGEKSSEVVNSDHPDTMSSDRSPADPESQNLPDSVSEKSSNASESEDDDEYSGPPTTLLAEIQLRKQQQKQRTRKLNGVNGLHATLLELDAVAEQEQKSRKGRRVNLAWEEAESGNESQEEDVPLGILYTAKTMQTRDINAAVAEINRPLGLMEQRELEDNEPLSRRRDRLQGRNPNTRDSQMAAMPQLAPPAPELEEDDEEPLAARQRRLKGESEDLPRARPVSAAFSAELLSQFGDDDKIKDKSSEAEKKESNSFPEEETLGQRRQRLQAEREASAAAAKGGSPAVPKVHSMADVLSTYGGQSHLDVPTTNRRASVFMNGRFNDCLGGGTVMPSSDPRAEERARLEQEARNVQDQALKMRAMRAAMPRTTAEPGHHRTASGFMGGLFNDGNGGTANTRRVLADPRAEKWARAQEQERLAREQQQRMGTLRAQMPNEIPGLNRNTSGYMGGIFNDGTGEFATQQQHRHSMLVGGYGPGAMVSPNGMGLDGGHVPALGMSMISMGGGTGGGMTTGAGMRTSQMAAPPPAPANLDRVEMWRHNVVP